MIEHRVTITPKVDLANNAIILEEVAETPDLDDIRGSMLRDHAARVINLRDKAVRDALICLGWRPPAEPYSPPEVDVRERVRAHDAGTSVAAAEKASAFASRHCEAIAEQLKRRPALTSKEIAANAHMTVEQVARRLPEMRRAGQVDVVVDTNGDDVTRDGCRVWRLAQKPT